MSDELNIRVEFKGDGIKQFEAVKKFLGLENNTEVVRILVKEKFEEIAKLVSIPEEA